MEWNKRSEQLGDLCRGACKVAGDVGQAALAGAARAGKAAGRAVDCARLRLRVLDLRAQFGAQLKAIGQLVYATHCGNPTDSATLQAALEEADRLEEELDECLRALRDTQDQ